MSFIFRRVVTCCCVSDYKVWKLTSHYLPKYVDSQEYLLIVPDNEVNFFLSITPSIWTVRGEGYFCCNYPKQAITKRMTGANIERSGWYLQQFLKINAILDLVLSDDDYVLIWDSDTIPLKKLEFVEDSNAKRLIFYSGTEHHKPYFLTLKTVFGIERVGNFSFIAQCLPTKVSWVREMLYPFSDYVDSILKVIPGESSSEFSEYETIGSFIFANYKDEVTLNNRSWSRNGGRVFSISRFNIVNRVLLSTYSIFYDYISFEKWQKSIWKG
jgi:hypothetical protein